MTKTNKQVLVDLILEAKRLRSAAVEAEADFLGFLAKAELTESVWRGDPGARTGYLTFEQMLDVEELCRPSRYAKFKTAVGRFGFERVREIGIDSALLALAIPSDATSASGTGKLASDAYLEDLHRWRLEHHTTPSKQHAESIRRIHYLSPARETRPITDAEEKILMLEREIGSLKKENARLKKQLADAMARKAQQHRHS